MKYNNMNLQIILCIVIVCGGMGSIMFGQNLLNTNYQNNCDILETDSWKKYCNERKNVWSEREITILIIVMVFMLGLVIGWGVLEKNKRRSIYE